VNPHYLTPEALHQCIAAALAEDLGEGDFSTNSTVLESKRAAARLLSKDDGIIAGLELAEKIFKQFDPSLRVTFSKMDGDEIHKGDEPFVVEGPARSILSTERVVLNCMQRMSGIATFTRRLGKLISHTSAKLMDTRKTTPNFRLLEKWAVSIGGGLNHRFALDDMIMIKDNHVDLAGGIETAVTRARNFLQQTGKSLQIEVETRNLKEVGEAAASGSVDVIMLDNMSLSDMKAAVKLIANRCKTEASGGITESNLAAVADCGVDFISMGALTHSAKSLDMSLKILKA